MASFKLLKVLLVVLVFLIVNLLYSLLILSFQQSGIKFSDIKCFTKRNIKKTHKGNTILNKKSDVIFTRQNKTQVKLKYILQWTSAYTAPFVYMGKGRSEFIKRNCTYTTCYVTNDRKILGSYNNFDLILFAGPQINHRDLPIRRSVYQKYGYVNMESADNYPICQETFNNFFNWTFTFRLDSDSRWGYMAIRNARGEIVGPNKEMHWIKPQDMVKPVDQTIKNILRNKSKAAAWFVSHCSSESRREQITIALISALKKFNLTIDIYGLCGNLKCPMTNDDLCDKILENDYYFYLSFENSFDEDYVTEKLLRPLQHNVVPVVYGGANYTRFMPEGIYLDVKMGIKQLASKMHHLINNPDEYEQFFRWKKYYSYHSKAKSVETDDYCSICALLNDENKVKTYSNYEHFMKWWNVPRKC